MSGLHDLVREVLADEIKVAVRSALADMFGDGPTVPEAPQKPARLHSPVQGHMHLNVHAVEAIAAGRGLNNYAEIARLVGHERSFVSRVLRNERTAQPSFIKDLARVLGVPVIALLGPADPDAALAELNTGEVAAT